MNPPPTHTHKGEFPVGQYIDRRGGEALKACAAASDVAEVWSMATPECKVVLQLHPLTVLRLLACQPLNLKSEHCGFYKTLHLFTEGLRSSLSLSLKTEEVVSHSNRDMDADFETSF